jgi:AraC-like DNA-binding protein
VSRETEESNRRLLRARDAMDRAYAEPLDVRAVAAVAHVSVAHFSRTFRAVFGETPHRYLQRRRVERSMFLLRETERSVTDICLDVGFTSLGTFSRTFREIVGETPSGYRAGHGPIVAPHCVQLAAMRPRFAAAVTPQSSSFGEASTGGGTLASGSPPWELAQEKHRDQQAERRLHLRPRQGRGPRLLREQAGSREGQ